MGDIINNPDFEESGSTIEEAKQQESEDTQVETSIDQKTESVEQESKEETSKESSEEEQPEEEKETEESQEEEGTDESDTDDVEDKEVEGLKTQKDKLSDEIVQLRRQRRTLRGDDKQVEPSVQQPPVQAPQATEGEEEFLPEEKKRLDKYLDNKGYVKQGEQAQNIEQEELDTFLDKHPEYDNNDLWKDFQSESKLYARPIGATSSEARRQYRNIFSRIHKVLSGNSTTTSTQNISEQKDRIKKASQGSGGGGSTTQSSTSKKGLPENMQHHMSGFTDEDFDDMN